MSADSRAGGRERVIYAYHRMEGLEGKNVSLLCRHVVPSCLPFRCALGVSCIVLSYACSFRRYNTSCNIVDVSQTQVLNLIYQIDYVVSFLDAIIIVYTVSTSINTI